MTVEDRLRKQTAREVNRRVSIAGFPASQPAAGTLALKELSGLWLDKQRLRVEAGNKKASSLDADLYRLKPLLTYFGDVPVSEIDETRVLEYQAHRRRLQRRPATINSEIGTLKHILKEGRKRGAIPSVPEVERIRQTPRNVEIPIEA